MPEMKRLVFGEGLMTPSFDGEKRFTVRKYREGAHDFKLGEIIVGEFKDGLNILLRITYDTHRATFITLKNLSADKAKYEYQFDTKYFDELKEYYPDLTWDDVGAVIGFKILEVNGVPVVSFNEHAK